MAPHEQGRAGEAGAEGQPATGLNGGTGTVLPARPGRMRAIMVLLTGGVLAIIVAMAVGATAPPPSYYLPSGQAVAGILIGLAGCCLLLAGLVALAVLAIRWAVRRHGVGLDAPDTLTWREEQELIRRSRRLRPLEHSGEDQIGKDDK